MQQKLPEKTKQELFNESINLADPLVQQIVKGYCIKKAIDYGEDVDKRLLYLSEALSWWYGLRDAVFKIGITEQECASMVIVELGSKQEVWRDIFKSLLKEK
jgi:hypothetical protein